MTSTPCSWARRCTARSVKLSQSGERHEEVRRDREGGNARKATTSLPLLASSPLVGSSRTRILGLATTEQAMVTRRFCPPETPRCRAVPMRWWATDERPSEARVASTCCDRLGYDGPRLRAVEERVRGRKEREQGEGGDARELSSERDGLADREDAEERVVLLDEGQERLDRVVGRAVDRDLEGARGRVSSGLERSCERRGERTHLAGCAGRALADGVEEGTLAGAARSHDCRGGRRKSAPAEEEWKGTRRSRGRRTCEEFARAGHAADVGDDGLGALGCRDAQAGPGELERTMVAREGIGLAVGGGARREGVAVRSGARVAGVGDCGWLLHRACVWRACIGEERRGERRAAERRTGRGNRRPAAGTDRGSVCRGREQTALSPTSLSEGLELAL